MGVQPIHGMRTVGDVLATLTGPARLIEALGAPKLKGDEPGVRMVAGKPYVFDGGALGDHFAKLAVENAPDDLSVLDDATLKALERRASRGVDIRPYSEVNAAARALHKRAWVELAARGFRSDGSRVSVASDLEEAA